MQAYDIEIIQTIKVKKRIVAYNENDAIKKGNNIVLEDKIPIEDYQLVNANIKAQKADNIISLTNYK